MSTKSINLFSIQDFFDKVFRKSGSYNSLNGAKSVISNLDTFCGRTPKGVLAKHYSDYSVESLREQYEKIEELFTLGK